MARIASSLFSIAVGVLYTFFLLWTWSYVSLNNPLPALAIKSGLTGSGLLVGFVLQDFLITLLLSLPAAWFLHRLGRSLWVNTAIASVAFAVTSALVAGLPLLSYAQAAVQYALLLASLPVAVWLLSKLSRNAPNNSFKPSPLRGLGPTGTASGGPA